MSSYERDQLKGTLILALLLLTAGFTLMGFALIYNWFGEAQASPEVTKTFAKYCFYSAAATLVCTVLFIRKD